MKIVKFTNGKFGVRKGSFFTPKCFLSVGGLHWFYGEDNIYLHCQYDTIDAAREAFSKVDISYKVVK